jgi:hypothetical protein
MCCSGRRGLHCLAACSSSGSSSSSSPGSSKSTGGSKTITIGFVTDLTGVASSGFLTSKLGIDAFVNRINAAGGVNGYKIKYVLADTNSTPTGALTAVQKLVQQDNVFAIVEDSSDFFGAEPYALQQGIPVVGSAIDGPYWADPKDTNLFASVGVTNEDAAQGQFMKSQGVTNCAGRGRVRQVLRGGRAEVRVPQHPVPVRQDQRRPDRAGHEERRRKRAVPADGAEHLVRAGGRAAPARRQAEGRTAAHRVRR